MESIYFNKEGKNEDNHGWNRIYKKSDKIYYEKYKYKIMDEMDVVIEKYVLDGYVLDTIKPIQNLVKLSKNNNKIYIWPKSNDIEEISINRLY